MREANILGLTVLLALTLEGYRDARPEILKTFFFCGCEACAAFAKKADPRLMIGAQVLYRGSPGDAEEFRRKFNASYPVESDPDGKRFARSSVSTCPAVMLEAPGRRVVLGNGSPVSPESVERTIQELTR